MKKLMIGVVLVLLLIVVAVLLVPMLVPVDTYKRMATDEVKSLTGRELTIRGDVKLSLFPALAVELNDVSLSNAPGFQPSQMAHLKQLALRLKVLPLLRGEVELGSFILSEPIIHLSVNRKGEPNWKFQSPSQLTAGRSPAKPTSASPSKEGNGGGGVGLPVRDIRLGDVRIVKGTVIYSNALTGTKHELTQIGLKVSMPRLDAPLTARGTVTWKGEKLSVDSNVGKAEAVLLGQSTKVSLQISSKPLNLGFVGSAKFKGPLQADGKWNISVPSIRKLVALLGAPISHPGPGFGVFEMNGSMAVREKRFALDKVKLRFDEIRGTANAILSLRPSRPLLTGELDLGRLDVNPYLPPESNEKGEKTSRAAPAPMHPVPVANTIPPHTEATSSQVQWSDKPIDFSGLKLADADVALKSKEIIYKKVHTGNALLEVHLKDGRLQLVLKRLDLYQGGVTGQVVVDASSRTVPALAERVKLKGVQAKPLLNDAAGIAFLSGKAEADIDVSAKGRSQLQLVRTLRGTASVRFQNGAIEGVNLGAMARNVKSAFLNPEAGKAVKTDFTELTGSFQIQNGVARNQDLLLLSPFLRLNGRGTIDLPRKRIDYRLQPRLVLSSKGQGDKSKEKGITVPILVEGPWSDIRYRPDLAGLVEKGAEELQKSFDKGGKPDKKELEKKGKEILRGLLGR